MMFDTIQARVERMHRPVFEWRHLLGPEHIGTAISHLVIIHRSIHLPTAVAQMLCTQARVEQIHSPIRNRRQLLGPEDRVIPDTKPSGRAARAAAAADRAQLDARCT